MSPIRRFVCFISATVLLYGCDALEYEDVSTTKEYNYLVGKQYQSEEDLLAQVVANENSHAQSPDENNGKFPNYAVLTRPPGISQLDTLFYEAVPSGSNIKILRVERSEPTFLGQYVKYVVTPLDFQITGNPLLRVHQEELNNSFTIIED
ncbi:MAG: hypothetical protein GY727_09910 [Gammaproteobacteria bacterium]|nr:hypothetical protein [Gammaproteobacteria bacterium]MCP4090771.1 hypothetical protein [Gammaproteobacteria bacterium]MCP4277198.1 hypothetical protein [Gammaproteobacteria bacterium]MCP4832820.1 hypothetical protein [Gammaproteobacteria bacterium]MCP4927992.1 hypothetical protein [Gammaproteobacteria bacterium]